MNIPSKHLERAVEQIASLPGVGKKSALKLALDLLRRDSKEVEKFAHAISEMAMHIKFCEQCHNISDDPICEICSNPNRDQSTICVVRDIRDVMAIENTLQFKGVYHVLGGVISPTDGVGPGQLNIQSLEDRANDAKEIILAMGATMEGDTTNYYLYKKLQEKNIKITTLSRGVSVGEELEYTDETTLGRSIVGRLPFESSF